MTWAEAFCTVGVVLAIAFGLNWDGRLPGCRRDRDEKP